jgi:hypothetical protein
MEKKRRTRRIYAVLDAAWKVLNIVGSEGWQLVQETGHGGFWIKRSLISK